MPYPNISGHISKDELIEYFTLHGDDFKLLERVRQDTTRLGFAILLKTFLYLGYPPKDKNDIPAAIVHRIADQLGLNFDIFKGYEWRDRGWDKHIAKIRKHTGFRPFEATDEPTISSRIIVKTNQAPSRKELLDISVNCREPEPYSSGPGIIPNIGPH